jgi:hypothetical protein
MAEMDLDMMGESPAEDMGEDPLAEVATDTLGELDPQFAADVAEAFPDLDDAQLTALQRAIQGLVMR